MEQELVSYIAKSLVDKPEDVRTEFIGTEKDGVLRLYVAEGDEGRIIGKGGNIAKAIRTVLQAANAKSGRRLSLEIAG